MIRPDDRTSELRAGLLGLRPFFWRAAFFSFFVNFLFLAPTLYMLGVYGPVLDSRSGWTLAMLTLLVLGAYAVMETLEWVRKEILLRAALKLDADLGERVFRAVFEANLRRVPGASSQALTDLRSLRDFVGGPVLPAAIDAGLGLFFLAFLYAVSPIIGHVALAGALLQSLLAWLTERQTQPTLGAANRAAIAAQNYANGSLKNAQVIEAMGMLRGIHGRWIEKQHEFLGLQAQASDRAGGFAAWSKFVQLSLSSLILGLAGGLVLSGDFPGGGGMMIAASVLGGKVLSPIAQVIGMWKQVANARDAYTRLEKLLLAVPAREAGMPLPAPRGLLTVESVVAGAPGSQASIIRGASFAVPAGTVVAIAGPSASGKSTLARLLVGAWPTASGKVRLDGVDVHAWNKAELGPHIGYLPQEVELFDGSLAENIARFGEADMARVEAAARAVGIHDLILGLPQAYDTRIGDDGCFLSGGQRQRVGLARAIYGEPRFVVLDEPNSSLDEAGEQALIQTVRDLKAKGTTVVLITHRTRLLEAADRLLILRDGQVVAYGPKDEVLAAVQRPPAAVTAPLPAALGASGG